MKDFYRLVGKSTFFFLIGVTLAALFAWSFIQGFFEQSAGNGFSALVFYFIAFMAGIASVYNYLQAKTNFHFAKLS